MDLRSYATDGFWDELFDESLQPRPGAEQLVRRLAAFSHGELAARQRAADKSLLTMGTVSYTHLTLPTIYSV